MRLITANAELTGGTPQAANPTRSGALLSEGLAIISLQVWYESWLLP